MRTKLYLLCLAFSKGEHSADLPEVVVQADSDHWRFRGRLHRVASLLFAGCFIPFTSRKSVKTARNRNAGCCCRAPDIQKRSAWIWRSSSESP